MCAGDFQAISYAWWRVKSLIICPTYDLCELCKHSISIVVLYDIVARVSFFIICIFFLTRFTAKDIRYSIVWIWCGRERVSSCLFMSCSLNFISCESNHSSCSSVCCIIGICALEMNAMELIILKARVRVISHAALTFSQGLLVGLFFVLAETWAAIHWRSSFLTLEYHWITSHCMWLSDCNITLSVTACTVEKITCM